MIDSTYIQSLTLINWRGYRYQTFEFDRMITGLEGGNGAGKTTAMIGVFSVLVPQVRHLRFRNPSSAEDGPGYEDDSIWGRLGSKGPSYALIAFRLPDGNLRLAGVMMERETEPKIKLRRFTITDIPEDTDWRYLFLEKLQHGVRVIDFTAFRETVAVLGGKVTEHKSFSQYSDQLYDWGVLPMRLGGPAEQAQYASLLKNSIYGGLSGKLIRELRSYLFTEDPKLLNHIQTVQDNLVACRTTRLEITRTEDAHEKISRIFDAGFEMAKQAVEGTFYRYLARKNRSVNARESHRKAIYQRSYAQHLLKDHEDRKAQKEADKQSLSKQQTKSDDWLHQCKKALDIAENMVAIEGEVEILRTKKVQANQSLDNAATVLETANNTFLRTEQEFERTQDAFTEQQTVSEEIARRVGFYRSAVKALNKVEEVLPDETVSIESIGELLKKAKTQQYTAFSEDSELRRQLVHVEAVKERFVAALKQVETLAGETVDSTSAYEHAKRLDADYLQLERQQLLDETLPQRLKDALT